MKDVYQPAEMEVLGFDLADVIHTSDVATKYSSSSNPNCPNEGPPGDTFL